MERETRRSASTFSMPMAMAPGSMLTAQKHGGDKIPSMFVEYNTVSSARRHRADFRLPANSFIRIGDEDQDSSGGYNGAQNNYVQNSSARSQHRCFTSATKPHLQTARKSVPTKTASQRSSTRVSTEIISSIPRAFLYAVSPSVLMEQARTS